MSNAQQQHDLGKYLEVSKQLALEAGKLILMGMKAEKKVEMKSAEFDLVTYYDRKVEEIVIGSLRKEFPSHKFIGEETSCDNELTNEPTWIIDPIDGTTNFVHGNPECCISIGFAINKELTLGIIYNPTYNDLYTAEKGKGAFLNGERIFVSKITELKDALLSLEPLALRRNQHKDMVCNRYTALIMTVQGTRNSGSAAMTLAHIARGCLDILFIENLGPWDVAAGVLLIKEAGGSVCDSKGEELDLKHPKIVAASCPELSRELVQIVKKADSKTERERLTKSVKQE